MGGSESGVGDTTGGECSELYVGDVIVVGGDSPESNDLEALGNVGRIDGGVSFVSTPLSDLLFLGCLHEVDGIRIQDNDELTTLAGLERLETTSRLTISGNSALTTLAPIGPIETLDDLSVIGNPVLTNLGLDALQSAEEVYLHRNAMLAEIDLDALHTVDKLYFGQGDCADPPTDPDGRPVPREPILPTEINGLPSLERVNVTLWVSGQTGLVSLGRLHEVAASGGLDGTYLSFTNNPQLPMSEIEALAETAGAEPVHCGNLDDEPCEPNCGLGPPP